jgi:hypothetical protein
VRDDRLVVRVAGARDPQLAPVDDAVQRALVPEVRRVAPEDAEPLRRQLEVVRLRDAR